MPFLSGALARDPVVHRVREPRHHWLVELNVPGSGCGDIRIVADSVSVIAEFEYRESGQDARVPRREGVSGSLTSYSLLVWSKKPPVAAGALTSLRA